MRSLLAGLIALGIGFLLGKLTRSWPFNDALIVIVVVAAAVYVALRVTVLERK